jgi:hypothetical protein
MDQDSVKSEGPCSHAIRYQWLSDKRSDGIDLTTVTLAIFLRNAEFH